VKHVVIVGAGPAGLAAAAGLARRGVGYTLLERGSVPSAALRTIDPEMALLSPKRLSQLRGMKLDSRYPTFRELVAALDRFREQHAIEVATNERVTGVERTGDGFIVHATSRAFPATHVINATGIVGSPKLPRELDQKTLVLRWMHSLDVRRAHIADSRRLLVVGGGASAAETLEHWLAVRRPNDKAWIATRSKIRAMPRSVLGIDFHYWLWPFEHLPGRRFGPRLSPKDPMWGYAIPRAIKAGLIENVTIDTAPNSIGFGPTSVTIASPRITTGLHRTDGSYTITTSGTVSGFDPDLVVFATGFAYDMRHLGSLVERDGAGWPYVARCESERTPNLYVLGARYGRNLQSPFLRGIAKDAELVAARIASAR
jgi:putative flavoprotein involved in K+ transport